MKSKKTSLAFLGGLTAGLLVGLGMAIGVLMATSGKKADRVAEQPASSDQQQLFNQDVITRLHAVGSHGGSSFSLATGTIDDGIEGVFSLDFLTGELNCWVPANQNGVFLARFTYPSVLRDLGVEKGKKPNFAMVTGSVNFLRGGGQTRPANCVVYIADCNTGRIAAYGLPWNRTLAKAQRPQQGALRPLGKFSGRSVAIASE